MHKADIIIDWPKPLAKYHVFYQDSALGPLHSFIVVIKYGERMVWAGWVFEEKKCMKSCGCPNVEKQLNQINIKQLITV